MEDLEILNKIEQGEASKRDFLIAKIKAKEALRKRKEEEAVRFYVPNNDKVIDWHLSDKTIKAIFGGNRTGKTEAGALEAVLAVLGKDAIKYLDDWVKIWGTNTKRNKNTIKKMVREYIENLPPAQSGWVVSPSYGLQAEGTQEKILKYLPKPEIKEFAYISRVSNIISQINLNNGKSIVFKTHEQAPKDFQSAGKGWIWFDEEPPQDIWKECAVRQEAGLTLRRWLTMTPVQGLTWVFDDIWLNKLNNPNIYRISIGWDDNPHLTEEQKAQMGAGMTEDELKVRREGLFLQREGLVYKIFSPPIHVIPRFEPDKDKFTFYRSFDFGFAKDHPFVALFFAVDSDGTVFLYNSLYLREMGQQDVIDRVIMASKPYEFRGAWADSARPEWIEEFIRRGIPVEPAQKDVEAGISKVTEFLSIHPVSKRPRLYITNNNQEVIQEFTKYHYPPEDPRERGKRLPVKEDDDGMDALRYFLFSWTNPANVTRKVERTYDESGRPIYRIIRR